MKYAERYYGFGDWVAKQRDRRVFCQIPTANIFLSGFALFALRRSSFNDFEQDVRLPGRWDSWLGSRKPSADTLGYALSRFDLEPLRDGLAAVAHRAHRRRAIHKKTASPYTVAALDGHELGWSTHICCEQCLTRVVHTPEGDELQYYHRVVVLQLVDCQPALLLDIEPVLPGEQEVAAALRIVGRLRQRFPRFIDVLTVDALYTTAPFFQAAQKERLHVVSVLKQEARDLYQDVEGLLRFQRPQEVPLEKGVALQWDFEDLTSWKSLGQSVRVVRSLEVTTQRHRQGRQWVEDTPVSDWRWVTTLSSGQAPTEHIAHWGHDRWDIENRGFNELTQHWAMDHNFHHDLNAILALRMILFLAFNLTTLFFARNLQPAFRRRMTRLFLARLFADDLVRGLPKFSFAPP